MAYDHEAVFAALDRKWKEKGKCPGCGIGDAWRLAYGSVLLPLTHDPERVTTEEHAIDPDGQIMLAGATVQPVMCGNCGFTVFFHIDTLLAE